MPITTTSGYAADGRPENPRVYPAGQEKATVKNGDLGQPRDVDNTREK